MNNKPKYPQFASNRSSLGKARGTSSNRAFARTNIPVAEREREIIAGLLAVLIAAAL
jgi:hypothetical protein